MLATATAIPFKVEPSVFLASVIVAAVGAVATWLLNRPSRTFTEAGVGGTVGNEYDAWTEEGILEYYWGEHIHLGYYDQDDLNAITNPLKSGKVFKDTKFKFVEEMYKWSGAEANSGGAPAKILDVGCGIGGTSRYLGNKLKDKGTQVTGITLSPKQVERATELAQERGLDNVKFQVMDALKMDFPDNTFDLVWGCESGEHMPDKAAYVEEMTRVLKPGGTLVIATWCQRELAQGEEFTKDEKGKLQFLYDEWAHPYFISIEEYERLCTKTGKLDSVSGANWVKVSQHRPSPPPALTRHGLCCFSSFSSRCPSRATSRRSSVGSLLGGCCFSPFTDYFGFTSANGRRPSRHGGTLSGLAYGIPGSSSGRCIG